MKDYSHNIIKEYKYRTLYIHENQSYLWRCYIACKRENAFDLTDATEEEIKEYMQIIKVLKITLEKLFQTDRINYSFLGNNRRHLHCHIIPRYSQQQELLWVIFEDNNRWWNRSTNQSFVIPLDVLSKIKQLICDNLN